MGLTLQCDDKFSPDKLIKAGRIKFFQRMMLRLMAPFALPSLAWDLIKTKAFKNPLHDGIRNLSGVKKVAYSDFFSFPEVKATSKTFGVTINDLMTAALAVGVKRIFNKMDPKCDVKDMVMAFPANIRWSRFEKWEDVELVNKFAPMEIILPLSADPKSGLKAVRETM